MINPQRIKCACYLLELERRPARELAGVRCAGCGAESPAEVREGRACRVGGGTASELAARVRAEAQAVPFLEAAEEIDRLEARGLELLKADLGTEPGAVTLDQLRRQERWPGLLAAYIRQAVAEINPEPVEQIQ